MSDQTVNGALPTYQPSALKIDLNNSNSVVNLNQLSSLVSTTNTLNQLVSKLYGVNCKWFRLTPQHRSADVIFQEYTLHNVEKCPLDLYIMYSDNSYDEAGITYQMMGISYVVPMTCEISVNEWNSVTNNDGTIPQKGDIVYIPQSNKLLQVASMSPVKTVSSQLTSYKCNLAIYKPERSVLLNQDLEDTIDNYTTSVQEKYGSDILDEILDATNDKQLNAFNSNFEKDLYKSIVSKDTIIPFELTCDGHIISKSYYHNSKSYMHLVIYKNSSDTFKSSDNRFISLNFRINQNKSKSIILSSPIDNGNTISYKCNTLLSNNLSTVSVYKGNISLLGEFNPTNKTITFDKSCLSNYPESWYTYSGIYASSLINNLISSNNFEVNLIGNNSLYIRINNEKIYLPLNFIITKNNWYNISLNISNTISCDIYDINSVLTHKSHSEKNIKDFEISLDNYYIKGSDIDLTNIRIFNQAVLDRDKQIFNIVSYLSNDNSKLIISDNADEWLNNEYYGEQR